MDLLESVLSRLELLKSNLVEQYQAYVNRDKNRQEEREAFLKFLVATKSYHAGKGDESDDNS